MNPITNKNTHIQIHTHSHTTHLLPTPFQQVTRAAIVTPHNKKQKEAPVVYGVQVPAGTIQHKHQKTISFDTA